MRKTDAELIRLYDASSGNASRETSRWYLDELVRRRSDKATKAIVELTVVLTRLTITLVVLTLVSTVAAVIVAVKG